MQGWNGWGGGDAMLDNPGEKLMWGVVARVVQTQVA